MRLAPWQVLESRYLLERHWLKLREDRVRTASGVVIEQFHVLEQPSWAAVVCVTENEELVLWELLEETGYQSDDWVSLLKVRPEPARHDHWAHFYVARGARLTSGQSLDPSENVAVRRLPLSDLDRILDELSHAAHIGALLLAERRGLLRASSR
jgi:ADP-ribose pyrophosphatase